MYPTTRPQIDKHIVIEVLLDGIEVSAQSREFIEASQNSGFMSDHEGFSQRTEKLDQLTDETIFVFNEISRRIGGIPVRIFDQDTEHTADILGINSIQQGKWICDYQRQGSLPAKTSYDSIEHLRAAYEAGRLGLAAK